MIPGLGKYPANGRLGGNIDAVVETASKDEAISADSDVSAIDDVTVASACSLALSGTLFTFSTFSSVAAVVATGASMTS